MLTRLSSKFEKCTSRCEGKFDRRLCTRGVRERAGTLVLEAARTIQGYRYLQGSTDPASVPRPAWLLCTVRERGRPHLSPWAYWAEFAALERFGVLSVWFLSMALYLIRTASGKMDTVKEQFKYCTHRSLSTHRCLFRNVEDVWSPFRGFCWIGYMPPRCCGQA